MQILFAIIFTSYIVWILFLFRGWRIVTQNTKSTFKKTFSGKFSVLVAFRNEEENLPQLLQSLSLQEDKNFEVILVNDHSTDHFEQISYNDNLTIQWINLENVEGKKAAIKEGLKHCKGEWILFTDADCVLDKNWVSSYRKLIECNPNKSFIFGPVIYSPIQGFWQKMFSLDFASLVASGMSFSGLRQPIFCNGANMAVHSNVYQSKNWNFKEDFASGDDVFLLQFVKSNLGSESIAVNVDTVVKTQAPQNIASFIKQRIRWASKSRGYRGLFNMFVPLYVLGVNFFGIVLLIYGFTHSEIQFFLLFLGMRLLLDTLYVSKFYQRYEGFPNIFIYTLPFLILYPVYIISAAALSMGKYEWKGRVAK